MEGKERAGNPPWSLEDSSGPSFCIVFSGRGRVFENCLTSSPAMCSQSAQLPPFPHRRSLLSFSKHETKFCDAPRMASHAFKFWDSGN